MTSAELKHRAKTVRHQWRRLTAGVKWGFDQLENNPIVFGNAMPKSGSHLLTQILHGLTRIGAFTNPGYPPVNRDEDNQPLTEAEILANLRKMRPGTIRYGYLHADDPYLSYLTSDGWAAFFLYRDPRDMLVSHVFYATEMHAGHGMHAYYNQELSTTEERINAAIEGVKEPGNELASVSQRYDSYLGWLDQPGVFKVRFEDLILNREETLGKMLDFLQLRRAKISTGKQEAVQVLSSGIAPRKSGTFRKGQPGNWRQHFTPGNVQKFKEIAPNLLIQLGYETSEDWSLES